MRSSTVAAIVGDGPGAPELYTMHVQVIQHGTTHPQRISVTTTFRKTRTNLSPVPGPPLHLSMWGGGIG